MVISAINAFFTFTGNGHNKGKSANLMKFGASGLVASIVDGAVVIVRNCVRRLLTRNIAGRA